MIKNKIIYVLVLSVMFGCENNVKDNLINKIKADCGNDSKVKCTVILKDLTHFEWDKMYLFGAWTISDTIAEAIGFVYGGEDVQDDYRRILFTNGNKVVHEEDFRSYDYYNSTLDLSEMADSLNHSKVNYFTPSDAIFIVEKGKIEKSCKDCFDYTLIPVKR